jgi:RHS repeat-associated protein
VTKSSGGAITVFVYNAFGQLIAEYGGPATNGGVSYLTTDQLGSARVVTNGSKGVIARHDYLPFGEEIPAGEGVNRTPGLGYVTTDDTTQRFTSKERDNESGLDHFGARYFSGAQGRFTSVDPSLAHPSGAQSWNRYTYTLNNPLRLVDPNGAEPVPPQTIYPPPGAREAAFYLRHPVIGSQVGYYERGGTNITTNTIRFATRIGLQETQSGLGTEVNAYRHVLWQAATTTKFGAGIATQIGNAHEDQPHVDLSVRVFRGKDAALEADQTVDLLNNEIGRAIGAANPNASMQQLALLTLDAFHTTGFFESVTNDNGATSIVRRTISDDEYNAARTTIENLNDSGFTADEQAARDAAAAAEANWRALHTKEEDDED